MTDACGREIVVNNPEEWCCKYCGWDNKAGKERFAAVGRMAAKRRKTKSQ